MNLKLWQLKNKVTDTQLSRLVGIHQSMICHYHAGRRRPSPEVALRIEEATGGEVTLREILFPDKREA